MNTDDLENAMKASNPGLLSNKSARKTTSF